ncbi:hypothetical protein NLU13_5965 [Sarocladium strictum]|uniref:SH3 domain-containing protein n=1 Tax=Sarocladium strictum TaxID=5046 RepID=A0AA39GGA7_SARSR|nr:hypothetical protein NLU13_5965 [Sarocladium strictum]
MATPFRVKAVYDYASPHEDDLNFSIGQIITVNDQEDDDWYGGEYVDDAGTKHEGIFPRNFVEKFEPTAPPRPTRTRTKKESEPEPEAPHSVETTAPPPSSPPVAAPVAEEPSYAQHDDEPEIEAAGEAVHKSPQTTAAPPFPAREPAQSIESAAPVVPPSVPRPVEPSAPAASSSSQAPKPKPRGPPPVADKPSSNSFKDRIAAFNKPAAPPVAPFKPGGIGGSSGGAPAFVKKPFVAAPPSRNAYVPPPREAPTTKIYRREEDPEVKEAEAQVQEQAEKAGFTSPEHQGEDDEDQPKPTSLKERIALLQKQQMEQAARHADAAVKKEKPKKPIKKPTEPVPAAEEGAEDEAPAPLERKYTTDSLPSRTSMDDTHASRALPTRRKSSTRPISEGPHDGNEADMSGAGDTTEGQDEGTEREESDEVPKTISRAPTGSLAPQTEAKKPEEEEEEEEEGEDEEEDIDLEVKRKEELRARMAKMSGGMGFAGMFGAPMPAAGPAPPKKKKSKPESEVAAEHEEDDTTSRTAPPIPTAMALPGMGGPRKSLDERSVEDDTHTATRAPPPAPPRRGEESAANEDGDDEEDNDLTPAPTSAGPTIPPRNTTGPPPPIPGSRPAPPPVPSDSRPAAPAPESPSEGSVSDDELSGAAQEKPFDSAAPESIKSPPPPIPQSPDIHARSPPLSPRFEAPPTSTASKRSSRPPPPIPGAAAPPVPSQSRPPPPPPPGSLSRQGTSDLSASIPTRPPQAGEEHEDEATEYEGDYDTDIASSVPHKDALKSHARDSSLEDNSLQSPVDAPPPSLPPPIPSNAPPSRAVPPPIPTQPPPENKRLSVDAPRAAPPPPPPPAAKEPSQDEDYDTYDYGSPIGGPPSSYAHKTPRIEEEAYFPSVQSPGTRAPPPPPSSSTTRNRQSMDVPRTSMAGKRSVEIPRPSMAYESGFIANDLDLAVQSGWWKQSNQVPPVLQGRRDIFFETQESTTNNGGAKTVITRTVTVLFQDYSQTIITARYDPYDPSDVELDQTHEPPPRPLRQDQMEEYYERFGRHISDQVSAKKDSVVGDGTPQGLIYELLKPYRDVLLPVGTRAYGALVYSNMANASTQQHDVIRPGDILSIRNAKFQGKHGPMHAKYTAEVGKPDHVAVVAEWDGTKKKVRAWEQGRENKKVKMESFKLDDLRSGEVKIWRVMPRSWLGWTSQP